MWRSSAVDRAHLSRVVCLEVLLPELVEHICCVKAGVVAQLAGDDLQGLGVGLDEQLRLAAVCQGVLAQGLADLGWTM